MLANTPHTMYSKLSESEVESYLKQFNVPEVRTGTSMYKYITEPRRIIKVDEWRPTPEDMLFKHCKGAICLPVSEYYGIEQDPAFDSFMLTAKRCYNKDDTREHICHYLNYFEKFYDTKHELLAVFYQLKYLIDYEDSYSEKALVYDLKRYILRSRVGHLIRIMNQDNYNLDLSYKNTKNPGLQYTNKHGLILMEISVFQIIFIPIIAHFIFVKKIKDIKYFLLKMFELITDQYASVDIINKLYETTLSTVAKNADAHPVLWNMQNIRAKNVTTHSIQTVTNILLQISPKYTYDKNIVHFNYKSILKSADYQVVDIGYEYSLKSLSSSKRDEDNNSEFDKYEAHLIKSDEALYIQNKVNSETSMQQIEILYGKVSDEEINFYEKELTKDKKPIIVEFQKNLIFYLFYKYFGDTRSINSINARDYIKLMIIAKRMLLANNLKLLPYLISGKITRLVNRVSINKKELTKIEASPYFQVILQKYHSNKVAKQIYAIIATLLSSKFQFIDYESQMIHDRRLVTLPPEKLTDGVLATIEEENINGKPIEIIPEFVCEEVLMYTNLI